jgi:hypothetical protein
MRAFRFRYEESHIRRVCDTSFGMAIQRCPRRAGSQRPDEETYLERRGEHGKVVRIEKANHAREGLRLRVRWATSQDFAHPVH